MADFRLLKYGEKGPQVQLLQTGLTRAGLDTKPDGAFGTETEKNLKSFQISRGLTADGIAGAQTWDRIQPYLTGYINYIVKKNDTIYKIAMENGSTIELIVTANPGIEITNLHIGSQIVVPLNFNVTPVDIAFTSTVLELTLNGLKARYPFLELTTVGRSVMGKALYAVKIGSGNKHVFYNASHHANEWITTPVLVKFIEEYAAAASSGGSIGGYSAIELYTKAELHVIPMVNPDGVDLVTGELDGGAFYDSAVKISEAYPDIAFPNGWKANIRGVDLNLQYPAGWEEAKKIKFAQGYVSPAPRDYVGEHPLSAPESRAIYKYTLEHEFGITISYHTQGEVIFWQYLNYNPEGAYEIARVFAKLSGYQVADVPYASGFAGYKDWFIYQYNRPGYTIEAGKGTSPLPLTDFNDIYGDNRGILIFGLLAQ